MGQAILVTSGKGGSGTTTFSINISTVLANSGAKVLLFDMNLGLRNDDIYLGLENNILFDIGDFVSGTCALSKVIISSDIDGLDLLPSTQCKGVTGLSQNVIMNLLLDLKEIYDYVVIDCPVSVGKTLEYLADDCEKALLVLTPDFVSIRNTDAVSRRLFDIGFLNQYYAVNRVSEKSFANDLTLDSITRVFNMPLVGLLAEDSVINTCNNAGIPVVNSSAGAIVKTFIEITARIVA